ncbi:hypothetical protein [Magnetospirillum sulfuroxidans]|uniref:Uncharacterized protein n=1 Tax=Magnetospirillum sulfuroxidans TaxID=611300 RepID=A0ABS5IEE1_9PROT|nr:hypothetical protein [Magnetospirillum sulfuroxidans]MBR9972791.1 hypothetical protein [Magnetospirillum sulfuroxidans]
MERMVARFFPDRPDMSAQVVAMVGHSGISGAELQALLLDHIDQPETLLGDVSETMTAPD